MVLLQEGYLISFRYKTLCLKNQAIFIHERELIVILLCGLEMNPPSWKVTTHVKNKLKMYRIIIG